MAYHEDAKERPTPRRDIAPICIWVTPEERTAIIANAQACGLSTSAYARNLALGHSPASLLDLKEVRNLIAAKADLGRLGGLLKMWLTDEIRYNQLYDTPIRDLLDQIATAQNELLAVIYRIAGTKR